MTYDELCTMIQALADAMERQDDPAIAQFFADDALMVTPGGRFAGRQAIYDAGFAFNKAYSNIRVQVRRVIADATCTHGVVEWSFAETRNADGWTHLMEDGIVFEIRHGKIDYWREYFDPLQVNAI